VRNALPAAASIRVFPEVFRSVMFVVSGGE
jgi:hypothetical protein